jgi:rubrerythrin
MDIVPLLDRCLALERTVGEVYDILARRAQGDSELREFWLAMAADERAHARRLENWRTLAAGEDAAHRTAAEGFEEALREVEEIVAEARRQAEGVSGPDDAFGIALEIEMSELDVIYTTLLESSPVSRYPDIAETRRREIEPHHEALVRAVRTRSKDEQNLTRAALIALKD